MKRTIFAVDTNCLVASISPWDKRHAHALSTLERRLARGEQMSISVQALTETYSVLTRIPEPYRISPAAAWDALEIYLATRSEVFALEPNIHVEFMRDLAKQGLGGGRVYDAIIGECARQAGATVLLTFNSRHFDPPPAGVKIVEPSD
ncbi:MAG: PIN domain-containing protein [Terriglobales bacterium]